MLAFFLAFLPDEWNPGTGPTEEDKHSIEDMGLSSADVDAIASNWVKSMQAAQQRVLDKGGFAWRMFSPGSSTGGSDPVGGQKGCAKFLAARCVANDTLQHSAMMMKAGPTPADFHQYLAAFLLVRGPYAWFGNAWQGCNNIPTRDPAVDVDYGEPVGHCEPVAGRPGVFQRQWTKATVTLDCAKWEADIQPHHDVTTTTPVLTSVASPVASSSSSSSSSDLLPRRFIRSSSLHVGRDMLPVLRGVGPSPSLPAQFDARAAWPECASISDIYDQGACGDCWAVATVTAASDRLCIATGARDRVVPSLPSSPPSTPSTSVRLSVEHMVGCCKRCGYGCADGFPNYAWSWLAGQMGGTGVVTGGQQNTTGFCSSYSVPPCNHYASRNDSLPSCEGGPPARTPTCPVTCDADTTWPVKFEDDRHKAKIAYAVPQTEAAIMTEIFERGPVTAGMNVYSDWVHYESGVYQATGGQELGGHAVRILGWGVEGGKKYWLVANSFSRAWGEDGTFKILRGVGECGIEQTVVAGTF